MQLSKIIMDRSVVLLLGVSVGAVIGFSFLGSSDSDGAIVTRPYCPAVLHANAVSVPPEVAGARQCGARAQRQLVTTLQQGRPVRIAVFGDSFGDGIWWGLQRQLKASDGYEVVKYSQPASGLTRY